MENGVRRWLVKISDWDPSPQQFSFLVSLLPPHEHHAITRFMKIEDRKHALVSRLLQYSVVHEVLKIPYDEIIINRTPEGKPYLRDENAPSDYPNFNSNASHSGDYVGIASEPLYLVGFDIVTSSIPKCETPLEFIRNFTSYFTSLEWRNITSAGTPDEVVAEFCRYWCLKEAYVKALGAGLDYGLDRIEFHHNDWTNISVHIDGKKLREWSFWLFALDNRHWASIARGYPMNFVDSRQKTLQAKRFGEEDCCPVLHMEASFTLRSIHQLIPYSSRDG